MGDAKELNIFQRLHAVMLDVDYIQKDQQAPREAGGYKYASHDAVVAKIRPALLKHGVLVVSDVIDHAVDGSRTAIGLEVNFVNIDNPEDLVGAIFYGYGINKQATGPGIATSYAFKTALLKMLMLETGEDPERQNVNHEPGAAHAAENGARAQEPGDDKVIKGQLRAKAIECIEHMGLEPRLLLEAIKAEYDGESGRIVDLPLARAVDVVEELKLRVKRFDELGVILCADPPQVTEWLIEQATANHKGNPLLAPLAAWHGWMEELRQREPTNA